MRRVALSLAVLLLASCGGSGTSSDTPDNTPTPAPAPPPPTLTIAARSTAADATARSSANACNAIQPFYWELGDASGRLASGSVNAPGDGSVPVYTATSVMGGASISKWIYAAYVVQKQAGTLSASDLSSLNFTSGYTRFSSCLPGQTVEGCEAFLNNGTYDPATAGAFYYDGGHMQRHGTLIGLGPLDNAGLAAEIQSQLGSDVALTYSQPQLAGGVVLRKMLDGSLRMGSLLGQHAVCTNPATCAAGQAIYSPLPASVRWHYALGHWVEDDPDIGDGAFSSAGAFGFYPWIDASKTWYGMVARRGSGDGDGYASAQCGRLIRLAWINGVAQ